MVRDQTVEYHARPPKSSQPDMNDSSQNPLETLLHRIRETLGELAPEPLLNRLQPVIENFLEQFQLVPKKEFETHLKTVQRLEATVTNLEQTIARFEQDT